MTTIEKREIQWKLRVYVDSYSSQKKAAESIDNCSEATVIAMLSEKEFGWDSISDEKWRTVANQIGGIVDFNKLVETLNFQTLNLYFETAKQEGATFSIIGSAGWGKSYAAKWYTAINRKKNAYYMECAEYWNKKMFLCKLLLQMGKSGAGMGLGELMETVVRELRKANKPVIILDEIDKLTDPVLKFFITLYNELNKVCGFIWLSTNAIEKRMIRGLDKNTVGYQELFSRIGATFVQLNTPSRDEIGEICKANGITDDQAVAVVCNEVKDLKGDLRRVDRNILKDKVKKMRKASKAA
jgi:DNA transposition AAA+ family ATPase